MMKSYELSIIDEPDQLDTQPILDGLYRFGVEAIGGQEPRKTAILLKDTSGKVIGGATGDTVLGNFYLTHLWVEDDERSKGHGSRILTAIENKVFGDECREIRLETLNVKAVPFYIRHEYEVFARVPEYIPGFDKVLFRKMNKKFNKAIDTDAFGAGQQGR